MPRKNMTQYNILFDNAPGAMAKLTRILAKEKIDAGSLMAATIGGKTAIQFVACRNAALRARLEKAGMQVKENQVFQLEMPNHHWELHKLAKTLAEEEINIISLYSSVEGDNIRMVMSVDQPANAVNLISKLGFDPNYLAA